MALSTVDLGSGPNAEDGDTSYDAFVKVNLAISRVNELEPVRRTAAQFTSLNETLEDGQLGIETDAVPMKFKIGDGVSTWASLAYSGGVSEDESAGVDGAAAAAALSALVGDARLSATALRDLANQSAGEVVAGLSGLTGTARLPASAVRDIAFQTATAIVAGLSGLTGAARLPASAVRDIVAGYTTAAQLVAALSALTGTDRLPATAIRDLPTGGTGGLTAEEVRDLIASFVIPGAGLSAVHDDAGETFTIAAQVTAASLAASLTSYLQTANLGAAMNTVVGDPSVSSFARVSAAGAWSTIPEVLFGDASAFDIRRGVALLMSGPSIVGGRRTTLLAAVGNVLTIPAATAAAPTVWFNFRAEVAANTTYGLATRDATEADQYQTGVLEIVNTSGSAVSVQPATSGGATGRVPHKMQPGALSTINLAAGACCTVFWHYAPALGSRAAEVRYNPVVYV